MLLGTEGGLRPTRHPSRSAGPRETRIGPRGGSKGFRDGSENFFFQENDSFGSPISRGICHARISRFQKIFYFPRPFGILLGHVRLDGWIVIIHREVLACR